MKRFIFSLIALSLIFHSCDESVHGTMTYLADSEGYAGGDQYNRIEENPFIKTGENSISTFSIDADGASYANIRSFIQMSQLPPKDAIRTEEVINFFPMDYPDSGNEHPIGLNGEVSSCPWQAGHKLIRIGIKGNMIERSQLPPSNIVLLVDVSGSMSGADRLGLLKKAFTLMVDQMRDDDRVAIVTYAGSAGIPLQSTSATEKTTIKRAINSLSSGGSTAGAQGIITAYEIAEQNFIAGGNNRIILGTDGDFNVGPSSQEELVSLIERERDKGIFLTVVGVGHGNLNDGMMEQVADHGNGTYEYLDSEMQAKKVFVEEYHKFYPAAKDVKVQVTFNSNLVEEYRLIGYENRLLEDEDFEDDKKDAGEISVGQTVTALYEIKPKENVAFRVAPTFTIDFRYKKPEADTSVPLALEIFDNGASFNDASENMRFASGLAAFSMVLRDSPYKGTASFENVVNWLNSASTYDPNSYREQLIGVVKNAATLK
jgi:Ca-activated chloride channel homolog